MTRDKSHRLGLLQRLSFGCEKEMTKPKIPLNPKHPGRICWGCDKYCSADDLRCGNGTIRTPHPVELFGEDWVEWELGQQNPELQAVAETSSSH
jgi:hypothetical protein